MQYKGGSLFKAASREGIETDVLVFPYLRIIYLMINLDYNLNRRYYYVVKETNVNFIMFDYSFVTISLIFMHLR